MQTECSLAEWLATPIAFESPDPRVDARRASEADFEGIYDLVNEAFRVQRPRRVFDWLYRDNPRGKARCWLLVERGTGRIIGSEASWPWPVARGGDDIPGRLAGDFAVAPSWQRRGLYRVWRGLWQLHPWSRTTTAIYWPNPKTLGAADKQGRQGRPPVAPLPRAVLPLRSADLFRGDPLWGAAAKVPGKFLDLAYAAWRRVALGGVAAAGIEEIRCFDSSFDALARRCVDWPGFWCPRDGAFLQWRYKKHPGVDYACLVAPGRNGPAGLGVVRLRGRTAVLMDLLAPQSPASIARSLLVRLVEIARAADCASMEVFAPPRWPHWRLLHRAGFLRASSLRFFSASGAHGAEVSDAENWQCTPGDVDCP